MKRYSATRVTDNSVDKPETGKHENTPAEINVPEPDMDQSDGNSADNELKDSGNNNFNDATTKNKLEDKVIAAKIIKSKDYSFHYSFTEGSLKLYGDFTGNPYKILEINSTRGKDYFLFYNEKYYYLRQNTRVVKPLELVKNQGLINELNILKDNK